MAVPTWISIGINSLIALFLIVQLFNPNQDAAGKGMLGLPIVALLACAGLSWLLMNRNYPVAALLLGVIPAIIAGYILFLMVRNQ